MRRAQQLSLLALSVAGGLGHPALSAAEDAPIRAGYWESRNRVSFPINDESTSRQCITPEKVSQFLSGPSTKNFACTYSRSRVADGVVSAQGRCVDKNGLQSTVDVNGTYAPTQFKLDARLTVTLGGLAIPVNASTTAIFLSETCPPEAR